MWCKIALSRARGYLLSGDEADAGFYEEYRQERQEFGAAVNASQWHYPMAEMRTALQRLAAADTADAGDGIILE